MITFTFQLLMPFLSPSPPIRLSPFAIAFLRPWQRFEFYYLFLFKIRPNIGAIQSDWCHWLAMPSRIVWSLIDNYAENSTNVVGMSHFFIRRLSLVSHVLKGSQKAIRNRGSDIQIIVVFFSYCSLSSDVESDPLGLILACQTNHFEFKTEH